MLCTLYSWEQHGEGSNSRKLLYLPLRSCHGKWSRMGNGGTSSYRTGEQRTCIVQGVGTCAITSRGPGRLLVSRNHFPACPHDSPKVVCYCSCTACGSHQHSQNVLCPLRVTHSGKQRNHRHLSLCTEVLSVWGAPQSWDFFPSEVSVRGCYRLTLLPWAFHE